MSRSFWIAVAERAGDHVGLRRQADHMHDLFGALARGGKRKAGQQACVLLALSVHGGKQRFADGEARKDAGDLKGPGNAASNDLGRRQAGNIFSAQQNAAMVGQQGPHNQVEERRLAGTIWPDDGGERPWREVQADAADGDDAAEGFAQVLDQQH
jgi:hypothetical protein